MSVNPIESGISPQPENVSLEAINKRKLARITGGTVSGDIDRRAFGDTGFIKYPDGTMYLEPDAGWDEGRPNLSIGETWLPLEYAMVIPSETGATLVRAEDSKSGLVHIGVTHIAKGVISYRGAIGPFEQITSQMDKEIVKAAKLSLLESRKARKAEDEEMT